MEITRREATEIVLRERDRILKGMSLEKEMREIEDLSHAMSEYRKFVSSKGSEIRDVARDLDSVVAILQALTPYERPVTSEDIRSLQSKLSGASEKLIEIQRRLSL